MTWLLLDAGNSTLKWALAGRAALAPVDGTLPIGPALQAALAQDLRQRVKAPLDAAFGCCVAGADAQRAIDDAVRQSHGVAVTWFASQPQFAAGALHLANGYRDPAQLGADRWHALLAARAAYPDRALVVVNAGTATTIDGVTADGRFVGGVIAPGVHLMVDSLARRTARLPLADGAPVADPDNTDDAIASGVLESQIGLIERRVRRFAAAHGPVQLLLAGGHAPALRPHLAFDAARVSAISIESGLVLRGVLLRAQSLAAPVR